jgi:hypothetical protein
MKNKPVSELFIADNGDSSMHRVDMKQYLNLPHGQRFMQWVVDSFNEDEEQWKASLLRRLTCLIAQAQDRGHNYAQGTRAS